MAVEIPLRAKYRHVLHGHYKSNHNMQGNKKRAKTGTQPPLPGVRTLVILPSGKRRMEWR